MSARKKKAALLAAMVLLVPLPPIALAARRHLRAAMWLRRLQAEAGTCTCPEEHYICPVPVAAIAREGRGLRWVRDRLDALWRAEPHRWELLCALAAVAPFEERLALGERVLASRIHRWQLWREADDEARVIGSGDERPVLHVGRRETLIVDIWLATVRDPAELEVPEVRVRSGDPRLALGVVEVENGLRDRRLARTDLRCVFTDGPVRFRVTVPADAPAGRFPIALEATLRTNAGEAAALARSVLPTLVIDRRRIY